MARKRKIDPIEAEAAELLDGYNAEQTQRSENAMGITHGQEVDFEVRNEGTVWIFYPKTERAQNFTDTDLDLEPYQRWPGSFVADHRVARDLVSALQDEGFVVVSQD